MWFSFFITWEQRKFESLAETRRGLTYNPSNISPHGIRVLRSSNINEDTFVLSDDDVFVGPDAVKIECAKPNDILITAANGSTRLVGKHAIIVGIRENEAVHGGFMLVASSSMPFFLNAAMSAPWYLKFINLFVAGGNGAIGNLNKNDLDNQLLFVPKNAEQEQIGEFFRNFDNLITLHQRKQNDLFFLILGKKSSLILANDWEQCKFAEVYSFASEGGTPDTNTAAYYRNGTIPFVRIEDTENKYIDSVKTFVTEEGLKHSSAWLIPSGSVIFTNGATVGNVAINRIPVATKQGILGIIPHKTVMAEYLYYLLSSGFFQREVRNRQATGTFATIILKNLNEINVFVPDKAEQQKISGYLSSIDNLITLHQRGEKIYNRRQT